MIKKSLPAAWFDATGILRWGAQPPTGIQRVEQTIYKYCRTQPDIAIAVYDIYLRRYRPADDELIDYLDFIVSDGWSASPKASKDQGKVAFRYLRSQLVFQDNETARRLAVAVTNSPERKGFAYASAKHVFRLAGWIFSLWSYAVGAAKSAFKETGEHHSGKSFLPETSLLVSHEVARSPKLDQAVSEAGMKAVYLVHDIIPIRMPEVVSPRFASTMDQFMRRVLSNSEPIITVSNAVREDILDWNRTHVGANYGREITVCPLGAAIIDPGAHSRPIHELTGKRFAVYCSTIEVRKRHDVLVCAWAKLAETLRPDQIPDLVFIGRMASGEGALSYALANSPAIANRVHCFEGIDDDQLRWAYQHAELGVFSSNSEGWGLGVSECLACGLPVVHSDLPALREAAQNLMPSAPAGDVDAWADVLKELFVDSGKLAALREVIRNEYEPGSPDSFARSIVSHLRMGVPGTCGEQQAHFPVLEHEPPRAMPFS